MRSTPNRATARAWTAERSSRTAARTALDRRLDVVGQVPGHALVNHLGHRAAPVGDDRGAARHGLHDGQAERLVEVDRVQQRSRIAEDIRAAPRADRAEEDDLVPVDMRLHGVGEIPLVLHDAADHQPSSRATGDLDGVSCSLVGMDAPERDQVIPSEWRGTGTS